MPESYRETDDRSRLRRLDDEIQTLKRKECSTEELSRLERLEDHLWTLRTERLKNEIAMLHTELASTEAVGETEDPETETEPVEERVNAETFLREMLADHEIPAETIWTAAREKGIAERTLKRVKSRLGVKTERRGYGSGGQWFWSLPKASPSEASSLPNGAT